MWWAEKNSHIEQNDSTTGTHAWFTAGVLCTLRHDHPCRLTRKESTTCRFLVSFSTNWWLSLHICSYGYCMYPFDLKIIIQRHHNSICRCFDPDGLSGTAGSHQMKAEKYHYKYNKMGVTFTQIDVRKGSRMGGGEQRIEALNISITTVALSSRL